jgi:chorismate mutase
MDKGLAAGRKKIDAIDARLARLLADRLAVARSLAAFKNTIRDPRREAVVIRRAAKAASGGELRLAVAAIFREIIRQGLRLQSKK